MFNLSNRKILLTGATGGIGQGLVKALTEHGAKICITGRRSETLKNIKNDFPNNEIYTITCDITDPTTSANLFEQAEICFNGPVDAIICNAGINVDGLAMRMTDNAWNEVIETNLSANFRLNRAAIKSMIKNKINNGCIINISSVIAHSGNPGQANYAASKAGLEGMSRSLAHEVAARGIRVNCIAPGFISSPMTAALTPEQIKNIADKIPMKKLGSPEDVAGAAIFLLSEAASYITGSTIHINGGLYM